MHKNAGKTNYALFSEISEMSSKKNPILYVKFFEPAERHLYKYLSLIISWKGLVFSGRQ